MSVITRPSSGSDQYSGLPESVARLRRAMRQGARVAEPENPLAVAQLELLSTLLENPSVRPSRLARLMHMQPNTVTTIVNNLSDRGLVIRTSATNDRRAVELTVTEQGRQAVLKWQAVNTSMLDSALSSLPVEQQRALIAAIPYLNAVVAAIEAHTDDK